MTLCVLDFVLMFVVVSPRRQQPGHDLIQPRQPCEFDTSAWVLACRGYPWAASFSLVRHGVLTLQGGLIDCKATHPDGRVIERHDRQAVADVLDALGEDAAAWTFAMTPIPKQVGGYVDGRPGYAGGEPIMQAWQDLRAPTCERPGQ